MDAGMTESKDAEKTWQRYSRGFGMMAWAFLFFLQAGAKSFDERGIAILIPPVVFGWICMLLAARRLRGLDDATRQIERIAWVGIIVTAPLIVAFVKMLWLGYVYVALWAASASLSVVACWKICNLISRTARGLDRMDVAAGAGWRRVLMPLVYTGTLCTLGVRIATFSGTGGTKLGLSTLAIMYGTFVFGAIVLTLLIALTGTATRMCTQAARSERDRRALKDEPATNHYANLSQTKECRAQKDEPIE